MQKTYDTASASISKKGATTVPLLGWMVEPEELQLLLNDRGVRSRPYFNSIKVSQEGVKIAHSLKCELHCRNVIGHRRCTITSSIREINGLLEIDISKLQWLSDAGWTSVLRELRKPPTPIKSVEIDNGVMKVTPRHLGLQPVRPKVVDVLMGKARHVIVPMPKED